MTVMERGLQPQNTDGSYFLVFLSVIILIDEIGNFQDRNLVCVSVT